MNKEYWCKLRKFLEKNFHCIFSYILRAVNSHDKNFALKCRWPFSASEKDHQSYWNKLASLKATLVRNYDRVLHLLTSSSENENCSTKLRICGWPPPSNVQGPDFHERIAWRIHSNKVMMMRIVVILFFWRVCAKELRGKESDRAAILKWKNSNRQKRKTGFGKSTK